MSDSDRLKSEFYFSQRSSLVSLDLEPVQHIKGSLGEVYMYKTPDIHLTFR